MNAGTDVHTLMREIRLPERFDLGEGYGKTSWNVRAIWENYAGWFHHRSTTELYGVPASDVAPDVVAAAGAAALVGRGTGTPRCRRAGRGAAPDRPGPRRGPRRRRREDRGRGSQPAPARRERQLLGACMARPDDPPPGGRVTNQLSFDFTDTAVLVTGGTSGIGHRGGERLRRRRRDRDRHRPTGQPGRVRDRPRPVRLPAGRDDRHRARSTRWSSSLDRLDVLVNNAGANFPGGRDEWEPDTFAAALSLNLAGPMRLTVGCRPLLGASTMTGGACVINMVSLAAFRSIPIVPGYASAKAGLATLTGNLAEAVVRRRYPGQRGRPRGHRDADDRADGRLPRAPRRRGLAGIAMGRLGTPADVVGAVQFLASSGAAYVTGHILVADGGYLLS